jgi:glycosyltransferase involved in cell wall biosynthesis
MRLFFPLHQADPGGIMTVTRGLAAALPAALGPDDELVRFGNPAEAKWGKVQRLVEQQWRAARAARDADLVHLGDYRPLGASRVPFVITIHDLTFLDRPEWYPRAVATYKRAMFRAALAKRPRAVVCVSEHTRNRFAAHAPRFDPARVRVIHPGVEPPPPAPEPSQEAGDREPYVLTVGAIEPRRNHLTLLEAFSRARAAGLGLRWIVVGRVRYQGEPIAERLRAAPGVELRGWVDDAELERLYRGARMLALPSHHEGFGFVPLEAMARGVPAAVATGSALDETAGDAALRVDPDDVVGWVEALGRLDADEALRADLVRRGHDRATAFTWERAARAHVELFRAVAAPAARG